MIKSALQLALVIGIALNSLMTIAQTGGEDCSVPTNCSPPVYPYKWCSGTLIAAVPFCFEATPGEIPGLEGWDSDGGVLMRQAVIAAADDWNFLTLWGYEIPIALYGPIVCPDAEETGYIRLKYNRWQCGSGLAAGCLLHGRRSVGSAFDRPTIVFDSSWESDISGSGRVWGDGRGNTISRLQVARHEFGHALGLGHTCGITCPTLMHPGIIPGIVPPDVIDDAARSSLECLYGNLITSPCLGTFRVGLDWDLAENDGAVRITKSTCDGCARICAPPIVETSPEGSRSSSLVYELAISDGGGPFQIFALLQEADWIGNTYIHVFQVAHPSAILRMRVRNGTVLVGEVFSDYPLHIPSGVSQEVCNGVDDDGDGSVDEDLGQSTCGVGACQRTVNNCVDGVPQTCVPGAPVAETCNGMDDDCDGSIDENNAGSPLSQGCYTGPQGSDNVGICHGGVATCINGTFGSCVGEVTPSEEIPGNGLDDDCDGSTDERGPEPDLKALLIDTAGAIWSFQSLQISGNVNVDVNNSGSVSVDIPFRILLFEDLNHDGLLDSSADNVLGQTTVVGLGPKATVTATVPVMGSVLFRENLIYVLVDSEDVISESNESNNYANTGLRCQVTPIPTAFNPAIEWAWTSSLVLPDSLNVMMTPGVADISGDGIPDVVFGSTSSRGGGNVEVGVLRALSGENGSEIFTITDPALAINTASSVAIGDIDLDGLPEILACDSSGARLIAFENTGAFKWRSPVLQTINWGAPAIADLNSDGTPEIVIGRQVLSNMGTILWTGSAGRGSPETIGPLSLVADVDLDGTPDVIAGNTAYRANGTLLWSASLPDGLNALGNFDADPYAEIVLVSGGRVWLLQHDGTIAWGPVSIPGGGRGGPPTVADFDGDGEVEIGVAGAARYAVFETNGALKWASVTQDGSSNVTGSSVFDFEGDGAAEVVYRDELRLRVYRGTDGTVLYERAMSSCTWYEYVLVADVDADGNAEIVAVANNNCSYGPQRGVYVFGDPADNWVATRKIWNQHTYHITNVDDNGGIPRIEYDNWLYPHNSPYNNYRQNVLGGLPPTSSPDLTCSFIRFLCVDGSTHVVARVGNGGAIFVGGGIPVSYYQGDPAAGGILLGMLRTTVALEPGYFEDVSLVLSGCEGYGGEIFVRADDLGNGVGTQTECDETNNSHNAFLEPGCDDDDACTIDDRDASGACVHSPVDCDDGDACTEDVCRPTAGCVFTRISCEDGDACTVDSCYSDAGCLHEQLNCDDGDLCTDDSCDPALGCQHHDNSARCNDGDLCTDDRCDPVQGCTYVPADPLPEECRLGCRITAGGVTQLDTGGFIIDPTLLASVPRATFGGQVGASHSIVGCDDDMDQIHGNWTHKRHSRRGTLRAYGFHGLICGCDDGSGGPGRFDGNLCNPGDRDPGPEPRRAPANIACFTGVGQYNRTNGRRTTQVAFRVNVEDRGEPGGGSNAGSSADVYRIEIWIPAGTETAVQLAMDSCCNDPSPNLRTADVVDGGNLLRGNIQIHPATAGGPE